MTTNQEGRGLTFSNRGKDTGYGFELEGSYAVTNHLKLSANYSFRESLEKVTNSIGAGPRPLVYGEMRWEFLPNVSGGVKL